MFGCYSPKPENLDLRRIYMPSENQSRIWFNVWDSIGEKAVKYMAFDKCSPPVRRPYPISLMPTTPFSGTRSTEPWLFSLCSMKGVVEIVICRDISLAYKPIIGLLLQYAGGSRACVGQFRFDMALRAIFVGDKSLHIGSGRTKQCFSYVACVTVDLPFDKSDLMWIEIRSEENLEWWFSSRHSIVRRG